MVVEKNGRVHAIWALAKKRGGARKKKRGWRRKENAPLGDQMARIVRAAGSLFRVAEGSPLSIIQRLLRETRGTSAFLRRCG